MATKLSLLCVMTALVALPATSAAQTEHRGVVFGDIGYARTWDDEGLLGTGASVSVGAGWRLTRALTLQAILDRIPYHRDIEYLTFDGRVLFTGVEAAFQSTNPRVRPFGTVGVGLFNDDGVWITKTAVPFSFTRVEERLDRSYTLAAMTLSGGLDFRTSERLSIRVSLRFHGLLDTGDDLAPHTIIRPGIGVAWRW
jgi:opacity protein-like surface antigen